MYKDVKVFLAHKQLKTHGCILSTEATAVALKHQAISTHSAESD